MECHCNHLHYLMLCYIMCVTLHFIILQRVLVIRAAFLGTETMPISCWRHWIKCDLSSAICFWIYRFPTFNIYFIDQHAWSPARFVHFLNICQVELLMRMRFCKFQRRDSVSYRADFLSWEFSVDHIILHYIHYMILHRIPLHDIALYCIILRYITYITSDGITLHYIHFMTYIASH